MLVASNESPPDKDLRPDLLGILREEYGIPFSPRGRSLDSVEVRGWTEGNCADPVVLDLPRQWVSRFAEQEGLDYLATLVSAQMECASETQLEKLAVGPDLFRRAVLKPTRH